MTWVFNLCIKFVQMIQQNYIDWGTVDMVAKCIEGHYNFLVVNSCTSAASWDVKLNECVAKLLFKHINLLN